MPRNKLTYNKDLDLTYIMDPTGKQQIGHMEGDQTNNPLAYDPNVSQIQKIESPYNSYTIPNKIEQMGKDFVASAASQAPLMIPGGGPIIGGTARLLGSLLGGYLTDRTLSGDVHTPYESAAQAGLNTTLGKLLPFLFQNKINFRAPAMRSVTTAEPTISETETTGSNSGTRSGEINSNSNSSSNLENNTLSNSVTETNNINKSSTNSKITNKTVKDLLGSSENISEGNTQIKGKNNSTRNTTTYQTKYENDLMQSPEHEEASANLLKEIDRLQNLDLSKYNKGASAQVDIAIKKNQEALDAILEANRESGLLTKSTSVGEGNNEGNIQSIKINSGKNQSKVTGSGETQGESNTSSNSSGISNTDNKGKSISSGKSNTTTLGFSRGNSSSSSSSSSKTVSIPGVRNTVTTGHSWYERLADSVNFTELPKTAQQKFVDNLKAVGVNTTIDSLNDALK